MNLTQNFSQVNLEKVNKNITGKMGLTWTYHAIKDFGIIEIIKTNFPEAKANKEIDVIHKVIAGVLMLISGGEKIEDIEALRADSALVKSIGLDSLISPDTFLNFLAVKRNGARLRKTIETMAIVAMAKSSHQSFTYDNDATYFDSDKKSASYSYKKRKQMSGLLGFFAELGNLCVTMDYRTGKVSPSKGILNQLRKAIKLAEKAGKSISAFRSDSAAHIGAVMDLCNKKCIQYYISLTQNAAIKKIIYDIKETEWQPVPGQEGAEWAETTYSMPFKKEMLIMRMLVLRWENKSDKEKLSNENQQLLLEIKGHTYHTIATNNNEIEPMSWLSFHNGRMGSENNNKELKNGFSCEYSPSHDFDKNRAYFMISILAYNVIQIVKLFYLGKTAEKLTVRTLRYWFINTAGKFVHHANKWTCQIINATDRTYQLFEHCSSKFVWYK
jgi:Transposase DDE domain group 1